LEISFHNLSVDVGYIPPRKLMLSVETGTPIEDCEGMAEMQMRFALDLVESDENAFPRRLHQDQSVPKSRNCPTGYQLGGVVRFATAEKAVLVALVTVQSIGFEGTDYRWLAVVKPDNAN
jgi:predicted secreted protein